MSVLFSPYSVFSILLLVGICLSEHQLTKKNCFTSLTECYADSVHHPLVTITTVHSFSVEKYCSDMRQNIIPCLRKKMNLSPSSKNSSSLILSECNRKSHYTTRSQKEEITRNLQLFTFGCEYYSATDLTDPRCFSQFLELCVSKSPASPNCKKLSECSSPLRGLSALQSDNIASVRPFSKQIVTPDDNSVTNMNNEIINPFIATFTITAILLFRIIA